MFDMDGVLCNYLQRWKEVSQRFPDLDYPQSQIGFFSRLDPIDGALAAVKKIKDYGYQCYILTRPSIKNIHCYTEKAEWIREYLGEDMVENLIIACDKSLVIGDYLIDDVDIHGQDKFSGEHIHFGTEQFPDWESVVNYLLNKKL